MANPTASASRLQAHPPLCSAPAAPAPLKNFNREGPGMLVKDSSAWNTLQDAVQAMALAHPGHFKYVPNQGNAGDALISAGTWQFFEDAGVQPAFSSTRALQAGDASIYAGGGNLVPEYTNCRQFLERCLAVNVASALVMPHTIRGHEALLARLDSRFTLVCRDAASLLRVQATGTQANVLFAPDMALYVDVKRLFDHCASHSGVGVWWRFARVNKLWPYMRWRHALSRLRPSADGRINVIRVDIEANGPEPGDRRWDVPNLYGSKYQFREEADLVSRDMLQFFSRVSSVRTNRLHVGVAAALMSREVTYLENSYGKIGAVYDAWLSHLPSVIFERAGASQ